MSQKKAEKPILPAREYRFLKAQRALENYFGASKRPSLRASVGSDGSLVELNPSVTSPREAPEDMDSLIEQKLIEQERLEQERLRRLRGSEVKYAMRKALGASPEYNDESYETLKMKFGGLSTGEEVDPVQQALTRYESDEDSQPFRPGRLDKTARKARRHEPVFISAGVTYDGRGVADMFKHIDDYQKRYNLPRTTIPPDSTPSEVPWLERPIHGRDTEDGREYCWSTVDPEEYTPRPSHPDDDAASIGSIPDNFPQLVSKFSGSSSSEDGETDSRDSTETVRGSSEESVRRDSGETITSALKQTRNSLINRLRENGSTSSRGSSEETVHRGSEETVRRDSEETASPLKRTRNSLVNRLRRSVSTSSKGSSSNSSTSSTPSDASTPKRDSRSRLSQVLRMNSSDENIPER
jgi:hypothetical protein